MKAYFPGCMSLVFAAACWSACFAQSSFDLEPPIQANTDSSQVTMSPDPDALPVFKFATAELDDDGNITIATKHATQKLVAPIQEAVDPEIDPRGIAYIEKVAQKFTVFRVVKEKDEDGNEVDTPVPETRTRTVPMTRYRKRTEKEQAEYEKKVAEHEKEQANSKEEKIAVAVPTTVSQPYQVSVPEKVEEDGKIVTKTRVETRTRAITVYRGKTETTPALETKTYAMDKVAFFGIDGGKLDETTVKNRLSERKPVILLNSEKGITPYFESLLNPEAIFVVVTKE